MLRVVFFKNPFPMKARQGFSSLHLDKLSERQVLFVAINVSSERTLSCWLEKSFPETFKLKREVLFSNLLHNFIRPEVFISLFDTSSALIIVLPSI